MIKENKGDVTLLRNRRNKAARTLCLKGGGGERGSEHCFGVDRGFDSYPRGPSNSSTFTPIRSPVRSNPEKAVNSLRRRAVPSGASAGGAAVRDIIDSNAVGASVPQIELGTIWVIPKFSQTSLFRAAILGASGERDTGTKGKKGGLAQLEAPEHTRKVDGRFAQSTNKKGEEKSQKTDTAF